MIAWLASYPPKVLFCRNLSLIPRWHGPVIADVDDPTFSDTEIALLNSSQVQVVVTTAEQLKEELLRRGLVRPIDIIPSGFNTRDLDDDLRALLGRTYNPDGHAVVGYHSPTLELPVDGPTQGDISLLARAMELVWSEMERVQLWLVGHPAKEVERWAAGRPQVHLCGLVPLSKLSSYIRNFTLGTYPRRLDHKGRFSVKLIEYMANGIPVVGTPVSETEIILRANAGVLANTPSEFANAILRILRDESRRELFRKNGLRFAVPYDWDRIAVDYEARIFSSYLTSRSYP